MMEMMRYGFDDWVQHIRPELGQKPTPLGWDADDCRKRPVMKYTPSDVLRYRSPDVARTYSITNRTECIFGGEKTGHT